MNKLSINLVFVLTVLVASTVLLPSQTLAQGLGSRKNRMVLYPKQAPRVFPVGANFAVKVSTTALIRSDHLRQIKDGIEKSLANYDRRFKLAAYRPETIISCTITELTAFSQYETRSRAVQGTVGTSREVDAAGNSVEVAIPGIVYEPFTLTILEGHLTANYETKDALTGKTLDADTLTVDFRDGFVERPPSTHTLYQAMIKNLTMLIASRFVIDFQAVTVALPRGKLRRVSDLLQNGLWNSALKELNALPPFKNSSDEAYRLYALGVAYEGLAYETPFLQPTRDYLELAAKVYRDARQKHSGEAELHTSLRRVEDLLAAYQKIDSNVRAYETGERRKKIESLLISDIQKRFGNNEFVNNNTIITWLRSGADESEVAKRLLNFKSRYFDLSPAGLATLSDAGVSATVIDAMREAMRGKPYEGKTRRKWTELNEENLLGFYPQLIAW
ncbi:MAG: hypothetical protein AB1757_12545 [Acidobacteriota bacterium]